MFIIPLSFILLGLFVARVIYVKVSDTKLKKELRNKSNIGPRRVTIDNINNDYEEKRKSSSNITFYGVFCKKIIECEYQKESFRCDVVFNIDIGSQTVFKMELGDNKKFKSIKRRFDKRSNFIELSEEITNETYYLKLHFKNNKLFSTELTNSNDTGFVYFDESIFENKP